MVWCTSIRMEGIKYMQTTFTIDEIKKYLLSCDSMGDIMYKLSAENIIKANQPDEEEEE